MCYVHSFVLYRVTLRQFSAFACCRIFGAGVSSFAASVDLIVLFLFDSYVTNKVIYLTYCLHVLRSFPRVFILSHCDDSQLTFFLPWLHLQDMSMVTDFCLVSPCFPVPACEHTPLPPYKPMCTNPEPSIPHLLFCLQNMMFGETSPAIGPNQSLCNNFCPYM